MVFAIGIFAIAYFVLGMMGGWSFEGKKPKARAGDEHKVEGGEEAPAMARSSV